MGLHSISLDINHVLCDASVVGEGGWGCSLVCAHSARSSNPEGSTSTFVQLLTDAAIRHGRQRKHRDPERARAKPRIVFPKTTSMPGVRVSPSEALKKVQSRRNFLTFLDTDKVFVSGKFYLNFCCKHIVSSLSVLMHE